MTEFTRNVALGLWNAAEPWIVIVLACLISYGIIKVSSLLLTASWTAAKRLCTKIKK